jgi:hypothetical protein
MIKKLVFVASPLSAQHQGERAKTGWLGIRIMWSDMSIHGLINIRMITIRNISIATFKLLFSLIFHEVR